MQKGLTLCLNTTGMVIQLGESEHGLRRVRQVSKVRVKPGEGE